MIKPTFALIRFVLPVACIVHASLGFAQSSTNDPIEEYVWGQQPTSAATEQTRTAKDLELRPTNTPSDVMRLVPGLIIGQHHGGGKADQILFRGFDSDHGTDFAGFRRRHPGEHGQPCPRSRVRRSPLADSRKPSIGWKSLRVPTSPHLGDFATSGAINIITKRSDKDSTLTLSGGSYNTQRYVGILAPPEGTLFKPYIAAEIYHNDGAFKNPNNYIRYNILTKFNLFSTANSNLNFLGTFFKTAWDASGEIPSRQVRSREIGRFGSNDPSEGGKSERQNLSFIYNYTDAKQTFTAQTWASWYKLQLWSNFSLFLNNPVNGDGIEQNDKRFLAGNNITYRRSYSLWGLPTETLLGFQSRFDHIRVGLFNEEDRQRLSTTNDNGIQQTNLGWFAHQEVRLTEWFRAQLGARLDNFWFNVKQDGPATQPISGAASKSMINPKLNLIFTPFTDNDVARQTNLFVNMGGGFHSNDSRVVVQDPAKALARYWSGELGVRTKLLNKVDFSASLWNSYLSSELVFVGDEGTFEPSGASRRQGIESEVRYDILPWLSFDSDISYTWAKFVNGEKVPLAPRFLAYSGLTARHESGLQARLQMRHIGRRYGIEDGSILTPTSTVFDLFLKYIWKRYEFFIQVQNLANTKWRSAEHVFESRTPNELAAGQPGQVGAHFTPGDPFNVKAGITIHLW